MRRRDELRFDSVDDLSVFELGCVLQQLRDANDDVDEEPDCVWACLWRKRENFRRWVRQH
jgi:hypothetical protein